MTGLVALAPILSAAPSIIDSGVLVSIGTALAALGALVYRNRAEISRLQDWAFGHDRANGDGTDDQVRAVSDQLDAIETKLDDERAYRVEHHEEIEREIGVNRYILTASINNLAEVLEEEAGTEFDAEDIRPDWVSEDIADVFDGPD